MCHSHIFLRSIIHQTAILRSIVDCQTPYLCFFLQSPPPQASQFQSHSLHHNHPSVPQELQRVLHRSPIRNPTSNLSLHVGHKKRPRMVPLFLTLPLLQLQLPKHQPIEDLQFINTLIRLRNRIPTNPSQPNAQPNSSKPNFPKKKPIKINCNLCSNFTDLLQNR